MSDYFRYYNCFLSFAATADSKGPCGLKLEKEKNIGPFFLRTFFKVYNSAAFCIWVKA